jgi:hypothetical protein
MLLIVLDFAPIVLLLPLLLLDLLSALAWLLPGRLITVKFTMAGELN